MVDKKTPPLDWLKYLPRLEVFTEPTKPPKEDISHTIDVGELGEYTRRKKKEHELN